MLWLVGFLSLVMADTAQAYFNSAGVYSESNHLVRQFTGESVMKLMLAHDATFEPTTSQLTLLCLSLLGGVQPADVTRVYLYKDNGNGTFDTTDTVMASGTFGTIRLLTLGSPTTVIETFTTSLTRNYFVVLSLTASATSYGKTIGVQAIRAVINPQGIYNAYNGVIDFTSVAGATTGTDNLVGSSLANGALSWNTAAFPAGYSSLTLVDPGGAAEIWRMFAVTESTLVMGSVKLSYIGTTLSDVAGIALYRTYGDATGLLSSPYLPYFMAGATLGGDKCATLQLAGSPYSTLSNITSNYLLMVTLKPTAVVGHSIKFSLASSDWMVASTGTLVSDAPQSSRSYTVSNPGYLTLTSVVTAPPSLTQGGGSSGNATEGTAELLRITAKASVGNVKWIGLGVTFIGTIPVAGVVTVELQDLARSGDAVPWVRLFKDVNGNGTWDLSDPTLATAKFGTLSSENPYRFSGVPSTSLSGFSEVVTTTSAVYFLGGRVGWPAPGTTLGVSVGSSNLVGVEAPDAAGGLAGSWNANVTRIEDRPDPLWVASVSGQPLVLITYSAPPEDGSNPLLPLIIHTHSLYGDGFLHEGLDRGLIRWKMRVPNDRGENETAVWNGMKISLTGNLPFGDIDALRLMKDESFDYQARFYDQAGSFSVYDDAEKPLGTFTIGANRVATLTGLSETLSASFSKWYELRVKTKISALAYATLGIAPLTAQDFILASPDAGLTGEVFSLAVLTLLPKTSLTLTATSLAPLSLAQGSKAAFWKLSLHANWNDARWTQLNVLTGASVDFQYAVAELWRDGNGNGMWEAAADSLIRENNSYGGGTATYQIAYFQNLNETIGTSGKTYFITLSLKATAPVGQFIRLSLSDYTLFTLADPNRVSDFGFPTSTVPTEIINRLEQISLRMSSGTPYPPWISRGLIKRGLKVNRLVNLVYENPGEAISLTAIRVTLTGMAPVADAQVWCYPPGLSASVSVDDRLAVFENLGNVPSANPLLSTGLTYGEVGLSLSSEAPLDSTIGLSILRDVAVTSPNTVGFSLTEWMGTTLLTLIAAEAKILDLTLWLDYNVPGSIGPHQSVEFLRWRPQYVEGVGGAVATALVCSLRNDTPSANLPEAALQLFKDVGSSGTWDAASDSLIAQSGFGPGRMRTLSGFEETLTDGLYFLVLTMNAQFGGYDVGVTPVGMSLKAPDVFSRFQLGGGASDNVVRIDTPDVLTLSVMAVAPPTLTQTGGDTFLVFTLTIKQDTDTDPDAVTTSLALSLLGTINVTQVSGRLYRDGNPSGDVDGMYNGDLNDDGDVGDTPITNGLSDYFFFGSNRMATLSFSQNIPPLTPFWQYPPGYLVRLSLKVDNSPSQPVGATVGLTILGAGALIVRPPDTVSFAGTTIQFGKGVMSTLADFPDKVEIRGMNTITGVAYDTRPDSRQIRQLESAPFLRFNLRSNDQVVFTGLKVSLLGDLPRNQISDVRLFRGTDDTLRAEEDVLVVSSGTLSGVLKEVNLTGFFQTLNAPGPHFFHLAVTPGANAPPGTTLGVQLTYTSFMFAGSDTLDSSFTSTDSTLFVEVFDDQADIIGVTGIGDVGHYKSYLIKNAPPANVLRVEFFSDRFDARLEGLPLSLSGTVPFSAVTAYLYRAPPPPAPEVLLGTMTFGSNQWGTFTGLSETISGVGISQLLLIKAKVEDPAQAGQNVQFFVNAPQGLSLTPPDVVRPLVTVIGTNMKIADDDPLVSVEVTGSSSPLALTQGKPAHPQAFLTINLNASKIDAPWSGPLTCSITGDLPMDQLEWTLALTGGGIFIGGNRISLEGVSVNESKRMVALTLSLQSIPEAELQDVWAEVRLAVKATAPVGTTVGVALLGLEGLGVFSPVHRLTAGVGTVFPVFSGSAVVASPEPPEPLTLSAAGIWQNAPPNKWIQRGRKLAIGEWRYSNTFYPFAMTLTSLEVTLAVSRDGVSVSAVPLTGHLYRETNGTLGWQANDQLLVSKTFDTMNKAVFTGLDLSLWSSSGNTFQLVVEPGTASPLNTTLRSLGVLGVFSAVSTQGVFSGYPSVTLVQGAFSGSPGVTLVTADAAAVVVSGVIFPVLVEGRMVLNVSPEIETALLNINLASDGYNGSAMLNRLALSLNGSAAVTLITFKLYNDNGDGQWQAGTDTFLASLTFSGNSWGTFGASAALSQTISLTGVSFVLTALRSAESPTVQIGDVDFNFFPERLGLDSPDVVGTLTRVEKRPINFFSNIQVTQTGAPIALTALVQGNFTSLLRLTLNPPTWAKVRWTRLQLSLTGGSPHLGTWDLVKIYAGGHNLFPVSGVIATVQGSTLTFSNFVEILEGSSDPDRFEVRFSPGSTPVGTLVGVTLLPDLSTLTFGSPVGAPIMNAVGTTLIPVIGLEVTLAAAPALTPPGITEGFSEAVLLIHLGPTGHGAKARWTRLQLSLTGRYPALGTWSLWTGTHSLVNGTISDRTLVFSGFSEEPNFQIPYRVHFHPGATPMGAMVGVTLLPDLDMLTVEAPAVLLPFTGAGVEAPVARVGVVPGWSLQQPTVFLSQGVETHVRELQLFTRPTGSQSVCTKLRLSLLGDVASGAWRLWVSGVSFSGSVSQDRLLTFSGFSAALDAVGSSPFSIYYQPDVTTPPGTTVGLTLADPSWIEVDAISQVLPFEAMGTVLWPVGDSPDVLTALGGRDLSPLRLAPGQEAALLELNLTLNADQAVWGGLTVSLFGSIPPGAASVKLYRDRGDGTWFSEDLELASATFESPRVSLTGFATTLDASISSRFFLALSLVPTAPLGVAFGLTLRAPPDLSLASPDGLTAGLTLVAGTRTVVVQAEGGNLLAWRGQDISPLGAPRGTMTPIYRLTLATDASDARVTAVKVRVFGSISPEHFSLFLYRDDGPEGEGWQMSDTPLGTLTGWAAFNSLRDGVFSGLAETITTSPTRYMLVLSLAASTTQGLGVGITLRADALTVEAPDLAVPLPGGTQLVFVDESDTLSVSSEILPPMNVTQGDWVKVLQFTLATDQDSARWTGLRVSLMGDLPPSAVETIVLSPESSSPPHFTTSIGPDRWVDLNVAEGVGMLIRIDPYVMDLYLKPRFNAPVGRTFGVVITGASAFTVGAPDTVSFPSAPVASALMTIVDRPDLLTVSTFDIAPSVMATGSEAGFLNLRMNRQGNNPGERVTLAAISCLLMGTVAPERATVRWYRDTDGNNEWSPQDERLSTATFGADQTATLGGLTETIGDETRGYFLALSLDGGAGDTVGVRFNGATALSVFSPDSVNSSISSRSSGPARLTHVKVVQMEAVSLAPELLFSGATAGLLRLTLSRLTEGNPVFTRLQLSLTGTLPHGDLTVRLYRYSGTAAWTSFDPASVFVKAAAFGPDRTGAFTGLNETITGPVTYVVSGTHGGSTMNRTFGLTIAQGDVQFGGVDRSAPGSVAGTPLVMVKQVAEVRGGISSMGPGETGVTLTQGGLPQAVARLSLWTDRDQAVLRALVVSLSPVPAAGMVRVAWHQDGGAGDGAWGAGDQSLSGAAFGSNGLATLSNFRQTLTTGGLNAFLVVEASMLVPPGLMTLTLASPWWEVEWPDAMTVFGGSVPVMIADTPDQVTMSAASTGPQIHRQNGERAYLALTLSVDRDAAVVASLKVAASGTLAAVHRGVVRWYADDGSGAWEPQDHLLASAFYQDGVAVLTPVGLTIAAIPLTTFLTAHLSLSAPSGETVGLSLPENSLFLAGVDSVSPFAGVESSLKTVALSITLTLTVSGVDLSLTVPQGTGAVALLTLMASNGSPVGDVSEIVGITFAVSAPSGNLPGVWLGGASSTLGVVSGSGSVRVIRFLEDSLGVMGSRSIPVMASVDGLASMGVMHVTLMGMEVLYPDVVAPWGPSLVGSVAVTDAPDMLMIAGREGPASSVILGGAASPLLWLTASIVSLPKDSVMLEAFHVSLLGNPPPGGSSEEFMNLFIVGLYSDHLLAQGSPVSRLVIFSLAESLNGSAVSRLYLSVSLSASAALTAVYGGTVGLSVVAAFAAGGDQVTLSGLRASSLRGVFDQSIHIHGGTRSSAILLTLGATQVIASVTLATDRDNVRLTALNLSNQTTFGLPSDGDVRDLSVFGESDGIAGWTSGDISLGGGSFSGGLATLMIRQEWRIGPSGTTLWVRGSVDPLMAGVSDKWWSLGVQGVFDQAVVVEEPAVWTSPATQFVDAPTLLWMGASDLRSPVTITGEPFLALRVSLRASHDGVGITRFGIQINAAGTSALAPHLTYQLYEGDRKLGEGGVEVVSPSIRITFALREPVWTGSRFWNVYVTPGPATPTQSFSVTVDGADVRFHGASDAVVQYALTTKPVSVLSTWEPATIRVADVRSLVELSQSVNRGDSAPVARFVLETVEPAGVARLIGWRVPRLGRGWDGDARLVVYLSRLGLEAFGLGQADWIGDAVYINRTATVTLINKPFLTNDPRTFWLVADIQSTALAGASWAIEVDQRSFVTQGSVTVDTARLPFRTPFLSVGVVQASAVRLSLVGTGVTQALQGAARVTLGTLTTKLTDGVGSVLTGLKLTVVSGLESLARFSVMDAQGREITRGASREGSTVCLTLAEPVRAASAEYALAVNVTPGAPVGNVFQITVPSDGAFGPVMDEREVNGSAGWASLPMTIRDAPDHLTMTGRARPVPWEIGEWTPAFLITLMVNQDEASLIRMTVLSSGHLGIGEFGNFRMRTGAEVIPMTVVSLGGDVWVLSLTNSQITRFPNSQIGALELSLSPSINLTGTLGLSLLGAGVAPDPVTGGVGDTVTMSAVGASLLGIRNPNQPWPPAVIIRTRYLAGTGDVGVTWSAAVKQGTVGLYRYALLQWHGAASPDWAALTASLTTPPEIPEASSWTALKPWTETTEPRMALAGVALAHGMTLYAVVQARVEGHPWSDPSYSDSIVIDGRRPSFPPRALEVVKGKKQLVISWPAPETGPSGVETYVIERRRGTKPNWEVMVSAQAPRLDPPSSGGEEWRLWYPSSDGHLGIGESGKLGIGKAPAISKLPNYQIPKSLNGTAPALQLPSYQINKLINAPIEPKLAPYLSATSAALPLEDGTSYYRVKAVSGAGETSEPSETTKVVAGLERLPNVLNEVANYPNPFDSRQISTTIVYVLNQDAPVTIRIYTPLGELVKEWVCEKGGTGGQAGANEIIWDGTNGLGQKVATGAYLGVFQAQVSGGTGTRVVRKIGVMH